MKQIIVTVDNKGGTKIETQGFKGGSCLKESEFLKKALGEETDKTLTTEYYQQEEVQQELKNKY